MIQENVFLEGKILVPYRKQLALEMMHPLVIRRKLDIYLLYNVSLHFTIIFAWTFSYVAFLLFNDRSIFHIISASEVDINRGTNIFHFEHT